jgi:hypothetical protein|tara:strand:+ start:352 stop:666 length:315 start_codon:yes stop_codon:yes gene_type:complete
MKSMRSVTGLWQFGLVPALLFACLLGTASLPLGAHDDLASGFADSIDATENPVAEDNNSEAAAATGPLAVTAAAIRHLAAIGEPGRLATAQPYPSHNPRAPPVR